MGSYQCGLKKRTGLDTDRTMKYILAAVASLTVLIVLLIIAFIAMNGAGLFRDVSLSEFLFGTEWMPSTGKYGAVGVILGTLLVTLGAISFAFPVGLCAAIYISEYASPKVRNILKPACEIFAGIPSVVYGFFGLVVLVPLLADLFPNHLLFGSSWLAASILLGIMALPTIISVSEDAIHAVPGSYREASLALGATRWETTAKVIVPAAVSGISAAITLGIGRAIGETMAVMMVSGNANIIPDPLWNVFSLISTITGTLALEMPEVVVGSTHYSALFMLAFVLMVLVLFVNLSARYVIKRTKRKLEGYDCKTTLLYRITGREHLFGTYSDKMLRNKDRMMEYGIAILCFVGVWMFSSLFVGDFVAIAVSLAVVAILFVTKKTMYKTNPSVKQNIAVFMLKAVMGLVLLILFVIIGYILMKGIPALSWDFITQYPTNGGRSGGIMPAIVGSLELIAGTAAIALPLGILTGIYLGEYAKDTKFNRILRETIDILNGTPSVVFGLFGLTFFVVYLDFGYSLIAGWLALAFMILPVIVRTTEEALRSVPNELREASRAMGATKWQTTYKVILPAAFGPTITGAILAIGRAAGETAPIMFTAVAAYKPVLAESIFDSVMALPYHLYHLAAEVPGTESIQYGTATVLLIIVLALFAAASILRNYYNKKIKW